MDDKIISGYFNRKGRFILTAPLVTKFGTVPVDFNTDGFTIPWFLRFFHAPFGPGLEAAIWHDYQLKRGNKLAHKQFKTLLIDNGISRFKANLMYAAVVSYATVKKPFT